MTDNLTAGRPRYPRPYIIIGPQLKEAEGHHLIVDLEYDSDGVHEVVHWYRPGLGFLHIHLQEGEADDATQFDISLLLSHEPEEKPLTLEDIQREIQAKGEKKDNDNYNSYYKR